MNMKRIILGALIGLAIITAGCTVEEDGRYGSFPFIEIEQDSYRLKKKADVLQIPVQTNRDLKIEVKNGYGIIASTKFEDNCIYVSYQDNDLEVERSLQLLISTPNSLVEKKITLVQDPSGELTTKEDLMLRSKDEIASNTYTKTEKNLIIGGVQSVRTKAAQSDVSVVFADMFGGKGMEYLVTPTDIDDVDLDTLTARIHRIGEGGLAIMNTKVKTFPVELAKNNQVTRMCLAYNEISQLPSADVIGSMGLVELSLKGNPISDVSSLARASKLSVLDLSETEVYDLAPIEQVMKNGNIRSVNLTGLPITESQLRIFSDMYADCLICEEVRQEESPLPLFGDLVVEQLSETQVKLSMPIRKNASGLTKTGFAIGDKDDFSVLKFNAAEYSNGTMTLVYTLTRPWNEGVTIVRGYAENAKGGNYGDMQYFGSRTSYLDVFLRNADELKKFKDEVYSHVNGSVFIGKSTVHGSGDVTVQHPTIGKVAFAVSDISNISDIAQTVYISDGLYMANTKVSDLKPISGIEGMQELYLKANRLSSLPSLKSAASLKMLDISRNTFSDFSFLESMPKLEHLYLGSSEAPTKETNEIGVLTGMEKYTNLKFIDLSGLPVHQWQVEELKEKMSGCEIVFNPGSRLPFIPGVAGVKAQRGEGKFIIRGKVTSTGKTGLTDYGFYYGKDRSSLKKVSLGNRVEPAVTFTYEVPVSDEDIWYYYPYAVNSYGESRCEYLTFTMAYDNLSDVGTANCYMVPGEGKYKFDATVKGNSTESVGTPAKAEVIWETKKLNESVSSQSVISYIGLNDGYVEFEVAEGVDLGNALIAVKDASGTILWSWHIWITDYEPMNDYNTYISGAVMMDRNLGAAYDIANDQSTLLQAVGTMYQWGRKDPFVYGKANDAVSMDVEASIKNPNTLANTGEWSTLTISDNSLWSDEYKSVYDPCPEGWMVSDAEAFHGMNNSMLRSSSYMFEFNDASSNTVRSPKVAYTVSSNSMTQSTKTNSVLMLSDFGRMTYSSNSVYYYKSVGKIIASVRCMKDEGFYVKTSESPVAYGTSIEVSGEVFSKGMTTMTDCGFIWSETQDNVVNTGTLNKVSAGSSNGTFTTIISNLKPETTYWIRAYAKGSMTTRYGEVVQVTTAKSGSIDDGFTEDEYEW